MLVGVLASVTIWYTSDGSSATDECIGFPLFITGLFQVDLLYFHEQSVSEPVLDIQYLIELFEILGLAPFLRAEIFPNFGNLPVANPDKLNKLEGECLCANGPFKSEACDKEIRLISCVELTCATNYYGPFFSYLIP